MGHQPKPAARWVIWNTSTRGFFSGVMPRRKNPFRYQLAVIWHGQQNLIDDPYSFGPLLKEMDARLLSKAPICGL